jgi:hypothetical protein
MGITDKKQALSGGKTPPPAKEEKKDTSIFGGKSRLEGGSFEYRLKDPRFYEKTGLGERERIELGKKLFGSRGSHLQPQHLEEIKRELDLGKWGRFKDLSPEEREKAKRLIKGISGK